MDESTAQPTGQEPASPDDARQRPSPQQPSEGRPGGATTPVPEPDARLDVDEQVRALLAATPRVPMPEDVEQRIALALAAEAAAAAQRSPALSMPSVPVPPAQADRDILTPLIRQRQRPRRLFAAAAVAAAAALVAVGGSALHLTKRPSGPAVAVAGSTPTAAPSTANVHIQLSRTAYGPDNLVEKARALLADPATPLRDGAAEAPSLGPIATEIGLASCLEALEAPVADSVSADLATYAGEPAAVIVTTRGGVSTAYVVRRSCTTGAPQVLRGATPLG